MAMLGLIFARLFWKDSRVHLFGFAAGTGNTGYFALPLVLAILIQHKSRLPYLLLLASIYMNLQLAILLRQKAKVRIEKV